MSERAIRLCVPAFLLACFLIGFGRWITGRIEIYPFGAWGMFHRIEKVYYDYDLIVHRLGERRFAPAASVRDPAGTTGLEWSGQLRLVMNGYARLTMLGEDEQAERYRDFLDREVLGPDSEYEIVRVRERARESERRLIRKTSFGRFTTDADLPQPSGDARFVFPDSKRKFQTTQRDPDVRRFKRKNPDR